MHELAVTESILGIAQKHALQAQAARVTDVYIVVGRLSSVVDDSVQFYWDFVSQNTICEGARLHFQRVPARLLCLDCDTAYTLSGELATCPDCNSAHVSVIGGEEFRLDSIAVEKTPAPEESGP